MLAGGNRTNDPLHETSVLYQLDQRDHITMMTVTLDFTVQLLKVLPMSKFSCPKTVILKVGVYLENGCPVAKISSISTPWGRKRVSVQFLEHLPISNFHVQN